MAKLFSCFFSLFHRFDYNKKKNLDLQFEIEALPDHLVISILNKMPAGAFCRTYSTCYFMADLADRGRGRLAISLGNPPNLAIECCPRVVASPIPGITSWKESIVSDCYTLKISYPIKGHPRWRDDPTLAMLTFPSHHIDDIPLFLCNYSYFKFNRVAIWTVKYSDKANSKRLVSILRREGIKCCSLLVDDEELVPALVGVMKPVELDVKGSFDFESRQIPRLPKMKINIVGFHPTSWETVKDEVLPYCEGIQLQIDMTSEATALEAVTFIEKMFKLHHLKVAVSVHLPRAILQEGTLKGLFSVLLSRMKVLDDLLLYPVPEARACTVLIYDRGSGWLLRSFSIYSEMERFLTSYRKFWRTNEENRAELDNLLKQVEEIFDK